MSTNYSYNLTLPSVYDTINFFNFNKVEPIISSYFKNIRKKRRKYTIRKKEFMMVTPVNDNIKELNNNKVIYNLGENFSLKMSAMTFSAII